MGTTDTVERCSCGLPLHYMNLETVLYVESAIRLYGPTLRVVSLRTGRGFKVPRHYIALHGLKGSEIEELAERFHWEEIDDG